MLVKVIRKLGEAPVVYQDASLVIVEDAHGNPILVGCDLGVGGAIEVSHVKDPQHNRVLRALGIDKTVVCDTKELAKPPDGSRLLT